MDDVANYVNRPMLYNNIDGVGELGVAVLCLGWAALGWGQVRSSEHSFWNHTYTFVVAFTLITGVIHFGSKAIKKYITYPRTGRVEYRTRDVVWRPMMISFAVSAVFSAAFALTFRSHWDLTGGVSLFGLLLAFSYARGFAKTARWKWLVVWAMAAASLAIALLPADVVGAIANGSWITRQVPAKLVGAVWLTMTVYGAMLLISGGVSFWLYLQQTKTLAANQE